MAKWTTVQVQLPEVITDLADILNSLIGVLLAVLEVVRTILNVVKALLIGLLDPIAAIIDAIISEIEALLNDIRQLGVYIAFDDVEWPMAELLATSGDVLGGFGAYEQRMIKRLVDRTDPTRPAFTSNSAVVAIFMYVSFDSNTLETAIAFIDAIKAFFHVGKKSRSYPIPTSLSVNYGTAASALVGGLGPVADFLVRDEEPAVAVVQWKMTQPRTTSPAWPLPPPPGFLIEVSTVPNGVTLAYTTTAARARIGQVVSGIVVDPEGAPFQLFGGNDIFKAGDLDWDVSGNTYTPATGDGKTRLFGFKTAADSVAIPPNVFNSPDGKPILQRTFFMNALDILGTALLSPGQPFSFKLKQEDMPYNATFEDAGDGKVRVVVDTERAREVYVRVSAVTKLVKKDGDASTFYWSSSQNDIVAYAETKAGVRLALPTGMSAGAKGLPSVPIKVTFPSINTAEYLDAVTVSIAILVLARADLAAMGTTDVKFQPDVAGQPTGLEGSARFIVPQTIGFSTARFFKKATPSPIKFRKELLLRCRESANLMLNVTGLLPNELESAVLEQAVVTTATGVLKPIYEVTWKDLEPDFGADVTILGSLLNEGYGSSKEFGVAPNPLSTGVPEELQQNLVGNDILLFRNPGFLIPPEISPDDGHGSVGIGSADYSPVLYDRSTNSMVFCRNLFLDNPTILAAAAAVLNIASACFTAVRRPGDGAWHTYRLFPNGIPPVDAALNEIIGFLNAIKASITSIADAIVAYIDFINARILELEALLRRIQALLDIMLAIEVPLASGLVVAADGTDGILTEFSLAENKPVDGSASFARINAKGKTVKAGTYGAGVVVLAGGLPAAVADLLQLIFVSSE